MMSLGVSMRRLKGNPCFTDRFNWWVIDPTRKDSQFLFHSSPDLTAAK